MYGRKSIICINFSFQVNFNLKKARIHQIIRGIATANPQQQEQLLQQVPPQSRVLILNKAQQVRQQMPQQRQQQQGYNPGGGGMMGVQPSTGPIGLQQPGSHPTQQQQQEVVRPTVVWSGIMELTEVVSFNL